MYCQYSPKVTGTFTMDEYQVQTPGGNRIVLKCEGEAYGPEIMLSKDLINFGDVPIVVPKRQVALRASLSFPHLPLTPPSQVPCRPLLRIGPLSSFSFPTSPHSTFTQCRQSTRVLELLNNSEIAVPYFFYGCEPNGMFGIDKPCGVVPPRLSAYVNFTFCPRVAGNYYKRAVLLLRNQSPLYVDIIGSGYTEKRRPAPLQPKFVLQALIREKMGLDKLSPEELQAKADDSRAADAAGEPLADELSEGFSMADFSSEHVLMQSIFKGSAANDAPVSLDQESIDFGGGSSLRPRESRSVQVINRTGGKMLVHWIVPEGYYKGSPSDVATAGAAIAIVCCGMMPCFI